jgi:peptidoglycan/LPS O-acetylase OafA/YrhL
MTGATEGRTDGGRYGSEGRWHGVALALTGGLVAASFMFFLIAVVQTPGLDPPPESAALFLVATTAGVISYELLRRGATAGYPAAMLAGGVVLVVVALIVAGTYGPAGPRTNPAGPVAYVSLAVAVILVAGAAWRSETTTAGSTASSPTS